MTELIKEDEDIDKTKIMTYYVNCRNHNSKYRILLKLTSLLYNDNYVGFSASFVYDKIEEYIRKNGIILILILDEIDLIKDVDDAVYSFNRANDETNEGGISIIGISNNIMFKDKLDPRTKSSLCQKELIFPPYNAKD
jgi:cell division control protein 6